MKLTEAIKIILERKPDYKILRIYETNKDYIIFINRKDNMIVTGDDTQYLVSKTKNEIIDFDQYVNPDPAILLRIRNADLLTYYDLNFIYEEVANLLKLYGASEKEVKEYMGDLKERLKDSFSGIIL